MVVLACDDSLLATKRNLPRDFFEPILGGLGRTENPVSNGVKEAESGEVNANKEKSLK